LFSRISGICHFKKFVSHGRFSIAVLCTLLHVYCIGKTATTALFQLFQNYYFLREGGGGGGGVRGDRGIGGKEKGYKIRCGVFQWKQITHFRNIFKSRYEICSVIYKSYCLFYDYQLMYVNVNNEKSEISSETLKKKQFFL
jgi:hypothetical protein